MKLKVAKDFSWAHDHVRVVSYSKGETIETDDEDLIRVAAEEGWAKATKGEASAPAPAPQPDAAPAEPPAADLEQTPAA